MKPWTAQLIRCEPVTRWMIRLLVGGVLSLALFGAGLLQWQLWKGQRAWAEEKARIQQEGESLDPRDYYPESLARSPEFLGNPLVLELVEEWGIGEKARPDLSKLDPHWPWGSRGYPKKISKGMGSLWRSETVSLSTFARVYREYSQSLGLEDMQLEALSDPEVIMRILEEGVPVADAFENYLLRLQSQSPELFHVRDVWGRNSYHRLLRERVEQWSYFEFMRSMVWMETGHADLSLARCLRSVALAARLHSFNRSFSRSLGTELQWIWELWIRGEGAVSLWEELEASLAGFPSFEKEMSALPDLLRVERARQIQRWTHPYGSWEFEELWWVFNLFQDGVQAAHCLWIRQRIEDFESWDSSGLLPNDASDLDLELVYQTVGLPNMVDSMLGPNRTLNWHHPIQEWQATRALVRSAIRCLIYKKKHEEWPASLEAVWLDHERADWQNPFTKEAVSYHPPEAGDPLPVISVRVRDRETRYWKGPAPRSSADVQRQ